MEHDDLGPTGTGPGATGPAPEGAALAVKLLNEVCNHPPGERCRWCEAALAVSALARDHELLLNRLVPDAVAPVIVAAQVGWRAVVLGDDYLPRECPIVAWAVLTHDGAQWMEPFIYGPADTDSPTVWRPIEDNWARVMAYLPPGLSAGAAMREATVRGRELSQREAGQ